MFLTTGLGWAGRGRLAALARRAAERQSLIRCCKKCLAPNGWAHQPSQFQPAELTVYWLQARVVDSLQHINN